MNESLAYRVGERRMPNVLKTNATDEDIKQYGGKLLFRRGVAIVGVTVALSAGFGAILNKYVHEESVCVTTRPAANPWNSGAEAAGVLHEAGVRIDDLREVTDLVETNRGGEEICGKTFSGTPFLTGFYAGFEHIGVSDVYAKPSS